MNVFKEGLWAKTPEINELAMKAEICRK